MSNRIYEYNYFVRLHNGSSGSNYFSIQPFDIDGNLIAIAHVPWYNSNLFYLSEDLKDGDTVVHFTDLTNWRTDTTQTYQRSFLIFNYTDSTGYTYPPGTYSRNYYSDIYEDNTSVDLTNNTITLKEAWNKGTIAAGTCISQTSAGSTYCYYGQTGSITNTEWKNYNGTIYAGDVGGSINENTLRLLYAKKIRISLYNNVADYAGLYLGEKVIDQEAIDMYKNSVCIGGVSNRESAFEVNLDSYFEGTIHGTVQTNASDMRLKELVDDDLIPLLKIWDEMTVVLFKYKDYNNKIQAGVIAQEIIELFNKYEIDWKKYGIVYQDPYTGYYSINYEFLNQLSILKVKLLQWKLLSIDQRLEKLENK